MRRLAALVLLLLVLLPVTPAAAQTTTPVVVIGVAGLRWDDVTAKTPVLQRLSREAAVGALSVKALPPVSCRADGWLTLGAGTRAEHVGGGDDPCDARLPEDLDRQRARNATSRDGAVLGALADALDGRLVLDGDGPHTAAGRAPPDDDAPAVTGPSPLVTLVDGGTLSAVDRPGALAVVEQRIASVVDGLDGDTDLLLVGLSAGAGEAQARLHLALATGPSFPRGALRSASTRRAPYVQLVDVAPTVLSLLDRDVPDSMDGQPWTVVPDAPSTAALVDLDRRAVEGKQATVPFHVAYLAVLVVALTVVRTRPRALRLVALTGAAVPVASYVAMLVPWWRAPSPLGVLLAVSAGLALALAVLGRRAVVVVAATAVVLSVDLLAGAPLQMSSVAGYSPLVAGRFAGLGNVAFGVYGTACLLTAALALDGKRWRTAGLGLVAVLLVGGPAWGSDVGGVLALLPAFALLVLLLAGDRVSVLRLALAGAGAAALVTVLALVDVARPATSRTHLGRFAADVRDGTAGELLQRKAEAVFALLFRSPVTALLPVVVAAAVHVVLRPPPALRAAFEDVPQLRSGLIAVGLMCLLGFLVNDSGAAVPAMALLVAAPATLAVAADVAERRARTRTPDL